MEIIIDALANHVGIADYFCQNMFSFLIWECSEYKGVHTKYSLYLNSIRSKDGCMEFSVEVKKCKMMKKCDIHKLKLIHEEGKINSNIS